MLSDVVIIYLELPFCIKWGELLDFFMPMAMGQIGFQYCLLSIHKIKFMATVLSGQIATGFAIDYMNLN